MTFEHRAALLSVRELCPTILNSIGLDAAQKRANAEMRIYCSWLRNAARAAEFCKAMQIPGTSPQDFECHLVSHKGRKAHVGLRFRSGSPDAPFIQIYARDFPSEELGDKVLLQAFAARYEKFAPSAVRARIPIGCIPNSENVVIDYYTMIGLISEIASTSAVHDVKLSPASELLWYNRYLRAYEDYLLRHPSLGAVLEPLTTAELNSALTAGTIYKVELHRSHVGLLVTEGGYRDFAHGVQIVDEVIFSEYQGAGIGAAAQRALAISLRNSRRSHLFGSISPENRASLETAKKVGRSPTSACCFYHLST